MRTATHSTRQTRYFLAALACALVILAEGTSIAGIQGSGFRLLSVGPISATDDGTISINGVAYTTDGAQIRIDGQHGSPSQLQVGQVVTVKGDVNADRVTGAAIDVSFTGDVRGPISSIDTAQRSMVVLGQTVRLSDDTVYGAGVESAGLEGLSVGTRVEVSGFQTAIGDLAASRIDLVTDSTALQVRGTVQVVDTSAATFRINALAVDFSEAAIDGTLVEGATATVEGVALPNGQLRATQVSIASGAAAEAGEHGQFEGLITSFLSAGDFSLGHQRVISGAGTHFVLHEQELGLDVAVKVRGTFNAAGVLVASKVEVRKQAANLMRGLVEAVAASQGTMSVLGVNVSVSPATAFRDKSKQRLRRFGFSDLRTGDSVEVRGTLTHGVMVADEVRLVHR